MDELRLGQLVYSKAGRDKGKAFLVISIEKASIAYVVDGDLRRVEKPKKKNVKHLHNTGKVAETIACKLEKGENLTNEEVQLAIAQLVGEETNADKQGG